MSHVKIKKNNLRDNLIIIIIILKYVMQGLTIKQTGEEVL